MMCYHPRMHACMHWNKSEEIQAADADAIVDADAGAITIVGAGAGAGAVL